MIQKGSYEMIQNWSSMISPAQSRAARGLIGWSQTELAQAAGMSLPTVKRFETGTGARVSSDAVAAIRAALETAGVIFIDQNGNGPGVRLRERQG
ncbi:multiprotein-bridging factor 1 family protein [Ancylobacter sp. Lp-2]|uniref:helix-turn-helix domain-containing protein n=1 Tax=Ancylobacter sp. Lp-2 TaxID=2881339 RepID=UPI00351CCD3F